MKIHFKKLTLQNFMSYSKEQSIEFSETGLTLLSGKNGQGKSTIGAAIYFALFGKSLNKVKLAEMINDTAGKKLLVTLEFMINDDLYFIKRGMKPNIFEIYVNGKILDLDAKSKDYQKKFEEMIGFDELIFNQLLYLGANVTNSKNFMELSPKEKEQVFQILLDTSIFNELKEKVKNYKKYIQESIKENDFKTSTLKSDITTLQNEYEKAKKQKQEIIDKKQELISNYENEIKNLGKLLDKKIEIDKTTLEELLFEKKTIENQLKGLKNDIQKHIINIKAFKKAENEKIVCDKCGNEIMAKFDFDYQDEVETAKKMKENISFFEKNLEVIQKEIETEKQKLSDLKMEQFKQVEAEKKIIDLKNKINGIKNLKEIEVNTSLIDEKKDILKKLKDEYIELSQKLNDLKELEILLSEDNLKGELIDEQIPILNYHINLYLEKLGMSYNFILDKFFKERIIYRNKDYSFNSLSNGQKMRVIIAILFAFLKLSEIKSKISFNILFLDEFINGSLDEDGVDEILELLHKNFTEKEIILITHNKDIKNKDIFNKIYTIENKGYSVIVKN